MSLGWAHGPLLSHHLLRVAITIDPSPLRVINNSWHLITRTTRHQASDTSLHLNNWAVTAITIEKHKGKSSENKTGPLLKNVSNKPKQVVVAIQLKGHAPWVSFYLKVLWTKFYWFSGPFPFQILDTAFCFNGHCNLIPRIWNHCGTVAGTQESKKQHTAEHPGISNTLFYSGEVPEWQWHTRIKELRLDGPLKHLEAGCILIPQCQCKTKINQEPTN